MMKTDFSNIANSREYRLSRQQPVNQASDCLTVFPSKKTAVEEKSPNAGKPGIKGLGVKES